MVASTFDEGNCQFCFPGDVIEFSGKFSFLKVVLGISGSGNSDYGCRTRLYCKARRQQERALAEVGVWHGVTTCRIRAAMSSAGTLFAVDPYQNGKLGFCIQKVISHREVNKIANGKVVWLQMTGAAAAAHLSSKNTIDFVFIDGDHSYEGIKADWEGWTQLLSENGVIALHDSRSTPQRPIDNAGSVQFTRDIILKDPHFTVIEVVDSLTVLQKAAR